MMRFVSVILLLIGFAKSVQAFKAQEPSPNESRRLIKMAENQPTRDGSTVIEALHHAEKMRPKVFKLAGPLGFGYRRDGTLFSVEACYWIGAKRGEGDRYCDIIWPIAPGHKSLIRPLNPAGRMTNDLMAGENVFLNNIDRIYQLDCINPDNGKKYC